MSDFILTSFKSGFTFDTCHAKNGLEMAIKKSSSEVIQEVTSSNLRGQGGAGFPTGLKLKLTAASPSKERYVICNADEGEPGTFKDRELLTNYADFVFCGMNIAAYAIGASQGIVYLRKEYEYLLPHLEETLKTLQKSIFNNFEVTIKFGAGAYVCGEETALLESLEGFRGEPRNRPPFPVEAGYFNKPTCLSNVETYARICQIMENGASWFNAVGTPKSSGYKLFSVSGDCVRPGIYEFPFGTKLIDLLRKVGGESAQAVQCGGAGGHLIFPKHYERLLAFEDLPPGGSIIIFGQQRNLLDIAENFLTFFLEESCGQCTPCREGNEKLLEGIKLMQKGECSAEYLNNLLSLCETMQLAAKCGLGQVSPNIFLEVVKNVNSK